jgi:hypothetical protein
MHTTQAARSAKAYEALARAKKVDAIDTHLILETVRTGMNPFNPSTAKNLAAFARNADEALRAELGRKLNLATPPSVQTMNAVAKRFEARS